MKTTKNLIVILFALLSGCGKYVSPLSPEKLAPKSVKALAVTPSAGSLTFTWSAPEEDNRGKVLRQIDGYKVMRKDISRDSDITDRDVVYTVLAEVDDIHLVELEKEKENLRAQGKVTKKAKVSDELKKFSYTDREVKIGSRYLYKIVPINQGSVEGESETLFLVDFSGETSSIINLPNRSYEDELL